MTRALAIDAVRYVSREYKDENAQLAKMRKKHGLEWERAMGQALLIWLAYGGEWCLALVETEVERRLCGVSMVNAPSRPSKSSPHP